MILIFVDETSDTKNPKYFGLCCAVINSNFYRAIKQNFQHILVSADWNTAIEFKGSHLFSASKGDTTVSVQKRIDIVSQILNLNKSDQNARMKFAYLKAAESQNHQEDYLRYLPKLIERILPKAQKKGGKDILSLHCDYRNDITVKDIRDSVEAIVNKRGYTLLEDVVFSRSGFHTVGILYADIVGYLAGRIDIIKKDSDLFEDIPRKFWETDGRIKKLQSSNALLQLIKRFKQYKVVV